jgi:hypothetical protein
MRDLLASCCSLSSSPYLPGEGEAPLEEEEHLNISTARPSFSLTSKE